MRVPKGVDVDAKSLRNKDLSGSGFCRVNAKPGKERIQRMDESIMGCLKMGRCL